MEQEKLTLIRYNVYIDGVKHGLFRIPQDTDLLDDEQYELYNEFYNELPFVDLEDQNVSFYFTLYGDKMQQECRYVSSALDAIPEGHSVRLEREEITISKSDPRIVYQDEYQMALKEEDH